MYELIGKTICKIEEYGHSGDAEEIVITCTDGTIAVIEWSYYTMPNNDAHIFGQVVKEHESRFNLIQTYE